MAIKSVLGATFTRDHNAAQAVPVSFTMQGYSGWIKVPTLGVNRVLFTHNPSRVEIGINTSNQIYLILDGVNLFTGTTPITANFWYFWIYQRNSSAGQHVVRCGGLGCVDNAVTFPSPPIEINVSQVFDTSDPTSFSFYVPVGCSVTALKYGTQSNNLFNDRDEWGALTQSQYVWKCDFRFPNDLYDHRAFFANPGTFLDGHDWTSISGSVILDSVDPPILLHRTASAILDYNVQAMHFEHASRPPGFHPYEYSAPQAINFSRDSSVIPGDAKFNQWSLGIKFTLGAGNITPADFYEDWEFPPDPAIYGHYLASFGTGAAGPFGYYSDSPQYSDANPSSGNPPLNWTHSEVLNSIISVIIGWPSTSFATTRTFADIDFSEFVWLVDYFQPADGPCEGLPPISGTGNIIVMKVVI